MSTQAKRVKVIANASRHPKIMRRIIQRMIWNWELLCSLLRLGDIICECVADALVVKERLKPRRVRAMAMTVQPGLKERIQVAQIEALRQENILMENLYGLDQQMEKKEAIREDYSTKKLAKIYVDEIVVRHGVPVSIISDRDGRFTSRCWQTMQKALGTKLDMSTAYHPQTNGQSERTIQTLEDMLRACVIDFGGSWDVHLPLAEFSYNNSYHSSIRCAPFEALYGRKCRSLVLWAEIGEGTRDRQKSYADNRRKPLEFESPIEIHEKDRTCSLSIRLADELSGVIYVSCVELEEKIGYAQLCACAIDDKNIDKTTLYSRFVENPVRILNREV
ncbi:putative reverse transcriptase domain-containing protein [Tanacetum coccineum]